MNVFRWAANLFFSCAQLGLLSLRAWLCLSVAAISVIIPGSSLAAVTQAAFTVSLCSLQACRAKTDRPSKLAQPLMNCLIQKSLLSSQAIQFKLRV